MQELLSIIFGQVRSIWRFRWTALIVAWALALVGWFYVYSMPNQYESTARVYIDTKSAIGPLLEGMAITPNAKQQANLLIHTVLSRPNLVAIARATGMSLEATTPEQEQALIDGLEKHIKLYKTTRHTDLYRIEYTSSKPKRAQAVVLQVMGVMTAKNLSMANESSSEHAITFLTKEVDKYQKKLSETEHKLASFKKSHAELLPGSDNYVSRVQQLNDTIDSITDQLTVARSSKLSLKERLASGGPGKRVRVAPAQTRQVQLIDRQISSERQKLSQLLIKYTPQHPDVIAAKNRIAGLEKRRRETIANLRAHPNLISTYKDTGGLKSKDQITDNLNAVEAKIKTLELTLQRRRDQLDQLRANSDSMNKAQATLANLSRNYEVTKKHYNELQSRLYNAQLSSDVEDNREALQFQVIDPPEVPAKPSGPRRILLMAIALLGSLVGGCIFAWFLAQIRPVFSSRRDLTETTGFPVIGSLSLALSPVQIATRRISMLVFIVACLSLLAGFAAVLFFIPLGIQWVPNIVSGPSL